MLLIFTKENIRLLLTYYVLSLSHRAGSATGLIIPCEIPSPAASPMHVSSPQRLPAVDQIQGPVSTIAVERDYLASTCPIESSDCMGDRNVSDIPDALLLEV